MEEEGRFDNSDFNPVNIFSKNSPPSEPIDSINLALEKLASAFEIYCAHYSRNKLNCNVFFELELSSKENGK